MALVREQTPAITHGGKRKLTTHGGIKNLGTNGGNSGNIINNIGGGQSFGSVD